ncbi:hypothetical protein L218DRAFT_520837 [Marasmius fiardii PR-910]|nr:hypothetical protein L218DRAFT_520837 [Marasmius fiardii PR-910]
MMSFPPPKISIPCPTFAPRKRAPPPIVIPLYATPITRSSSPPLSVHRTLRERPLYHPYAHARHGASRPCPTLIVVDTESSTATPSSAAAGPSSTGTSSSAAAGTSSTESVPPSPLTPQVDELAPEPTRAVPVLIPPPHKKDLSVNNAGWHEAQQAVYRELAKTAIRGHLDFKKNLSDQDATARQNAIKVIEDSVEAFKNHKNHWGAVTLLRDQLKSMKDTAAKREKRANASRTTKSQTEGA